MIDTQKQAVADITTTVKWLSSKIQLAKRFNEDGSYRCLVAAKGFFQNACY